MGHVEFGVSSGTPRGGRSRIFSRWLELWTVVVEENQDGETGLKLIVEGMGMKDTVQGMSVRKIKW